MGFEEFNLVRQANFVDEGLCQILKVKSSVSLCWMTEESQIETESLMSIKYLPILSIEVFLKESHCFKLTFWNHWLRCLKLYYFSQLNRQKLSYSFNSLDYFGSWQSTTHSLALPVYLVINFSENQESYSKFVHFIHLKYSERSPKNDGLLH